MLESSKPFRKGTGGQDLPTTRCPVWGLELSSLTKGTLKHVLKGSPLSLGSVLLILLNQRETFIFNKTAEKRWFRDLIRSPLTNSRTQISI